MDVAKVNAFFCLIPDFGRLYWTQTFLNVQPNRKCVLNFYIKA